MTTNCSAPLLQPETDEATLFHFIKFHLGDWSGGTQGMSLEHEGAYIRFLVRLYQRGKPLPDDDRFMSTAMGLSLRVWKRVKDALIAAGKILAKAGALTNARFEKERQRRAEEIRKKAEAAHNRHARERSLAEVCGKFDPSLGETSAKLQGNTSKKPNENNDAQSNIHVLTNNHKPITREDKPPVSPPSQGDKPKRAHQMPAGWRPAAGTLEWARGDKIGATQAEIDDQFEHFRDYHQAKGSRFVSWDQAFQTWMRNFRTRFRPKSNGQANGWANGRSYSMSGAYIGELL